NDNDFSGAEYVLLNITYGDQEVLMDEITEITDYIQDAAGSTADVIFGHAKDDSLGDKISVTVIATGFQSTPITGFETAPKKNVTTLEEDKKKEVVAPLNTPTQTNPWAGAKEVVAQDEPFLKGEPEAKEAPAKTWNVEPVASEEKEELALDWNVTNTTEEADEPVLKAEVSKEEVKRFTLEDDMEEMDLDAVNSKEIVSPKVQQERSEERLSKIQEYTQRLKKADGIQDLENEPAYIRRNITLDESMPSEEDNTSRFSVSKDENGSSLSGNNSFLHDNVD
ncbi:MAG: cell division protein FtsZ, partial [Crocinitomicaceae bacterium]|nr:cell division protein FtsZ [Crocinitomicaceae bacterium]